MREPISALSAIVGRRGVVLLALATVWLLFGASIATYTPPPGVSGRFQLPLADSPVWAGLWIVCGVVAAVVAVRRRSGHDDPLGWAAAITPPAIWAAVYGISALWALASDGEIGSDRAWVSLITWTLVAALIRTIAGWEDLLDRADEGM